MSEREQLHDTLIQLRTRVDAHFEAAVERSPAAFRCREGCDECCQRRFSVFEVEAAPIRRALAALGQADPDARRRVREQADDPGYASTCPLLVDGSCVVYESRPMICRSHGLPIAVETQGKTVVDHCRLNFTDTRPPPASVLVLAAVNLPLASLAHLWDGEGARIELAELARAHD